MDFQMFVSTIIKQNYTVANCSKTGGGCVWHTVCVCVRMFIFVKIFYLHWCENIWPDRLFQIWAVNDVQFLKCYHLTGHCWQINFELHYQIDSYSVVWIPNFLLCAVFSSLMPITFEISRGDLSIFLTRTLSSWSSSTAVTEKCAKFKHMQFVSLIHIYWLTQHATILLRI